MSERRPIFVRRAVAPDSDPVEHAPRIEIRKPRASQPSNGGIRVVRTRLVPVEISNPVSGEEYRSDRIELRGQAPPRRRLKVLCNEEMLTNVESDDRGEFSLRNLRVPRGDVVLRVEDSLQKDPEQGSAVVSFSVRSLSALSLYQPIQDQVLEEKVLRFSGQGTSEEPLTIEVDGRTISATCDHEGGFVGTALLRKAGNYELKVKYADSPETATCERQFAWYGIDFPSMRDPATGESLKPGEDIIRCQECRDYFYRGTWLGYGGCPNRCRGGICWDRSHPDFAKAKRLLTRL